MSDQTPETPQELGESGRALFESVVSDFELDIHELLLLRNAARAADNLDELHEQARNAPLTVTNGRGDVTTNPLLVEFRQQSILLGRMLSSLRLPSGETEGRPQRRGAARGFYNTGRLKSV